MKQIKLSILLTALLSMVGTRAIAHDIEVKNADGITIFYYWVNNKTELSVSYRGSFYNSYNNEYLGNVVIPESVTYNGATYPVTSIGAYAFYFCRSLTSVTIPNSVKTIGYSAFEDCSGLTSVTIGNSVTSIGGSAFYSCSGLTSVTIPNSVTTIGNYAFLGCSGLTDITIPNSVTYIGDFAFQNCPNIKEPIYNSTVFAFLPNSYKGKYVIPDSHKQIAGGAFSGCQGLTDITIPNSVTSIGNYAFFGCSGLTSVTIPNSVTSIGSSAFSGCSGLNSVIVGNGITDIPAYVFGTGNSLKSLTIGSGVLSIDQGAFRSGSSNSSSYKPIKTIWLTNTPPSGYSYAAGTVNYVANNLYTSLSNKTVYSFLSSMFEVDGVKYVPVSPSERTCDAIDCLYDGTAENINIGKTVSYKGVEMTVQRVHKYACYGNSFMKNVEVSLNGNVEDYAFSGCANIGQLTVANSGNIGVSAFQGITSECTANINNSGVIGAKAFIQSTGLTTATIGEGVTGIGDYAFYGCSSLGSIVIPNAVASLGSSAFQNCSKMTSAKIGTGVKTINQYTFSGCAALTDMQIGSNVKTIERSAFNGCTALPKIQIPQSVTNIGNYVFGGCTGLKTVIMDDGQESELKLGYNYFSSGGNKPLFSDCPLDSVYIGRNISYSTESSYGYSPFYRNTSLRSVHITDKETEISPNEFYGCTNLKNVRIGDGVTTIGDWAFSGCSSIDFFSFGSSVKTIGQEAFSDCTAMTKLISRATTPPSCGSQALDDINKWNCTLSVPKGYASAYQQAAQWKEFFFINDDATTAIKPISDNAVEIIENYDLNGTRQNRLQKGVNIVRMSDGTVKKVIVK